MGQLGFFSGILGLPPPWQVTSVSCDRKGGHLNIIVAFQDASPLSCPACGATGAGEPRLETWRHSGFLDRALYLHARMPSIACSCGVCPVERPWCRAGSGFAPEP